MQVLINTGVCEQKQPSHYIAIYRHIHIRPQHTSRKTYSYKSMYIYIYILRRSLLSQTPIGIYIPISSFWLNHPRTTDADPYPINTDFQYLDFAYLLVLYRATKIRITCRTGGRQYHHFAGRHRDRTLASHWWPPGAREFPATDNHGTMIHSLHNAEV